MLIQHRAGRGLLPALLLALVCPARAETTQSARLMPGTPHETALFLKQGEGAEPSIMVIGGFHGDEMAGYLAARRLLDWQVTRGMLIVLPEANPQAIRRRERGTLNRLLPGDPNGDGLQRLAAAIWRAVDFYRPGLLLTLHESVDFHARDSSRYGQTLCYDFAALTPLMQRVLDRANPDLADPLHQFHTFVKPFPDCPTYLAHEKLGIPATAIETCRKLPLEQRIQQQLMVLMAFFDECGLGYEPAGLPRLSTATRPPDTQLHSGRSWDE